MLVGGSQDESHSDVATGRSAFSRCSLLAGRFHISTLTYRREVAEVPLGAGRLR